MTTHDHVRQSTAASVNREIREETARQIAEARQSPQQIRDRLDEIDAEWNIERALETLSASLSLAGLALGMRGRLRWLRLPLVVQSFLLQHALQGWCPPLPVLRRLGFRTQQEIERERYTLRAMLREHVGRPDVDRPAERPAKPTGEAAGNPAAIAKAGR